MNISKPQVQDACRDLSTYHKIKIYQLHSYNKDQVYNISLHGLLSRPCEDIFKKTIYSN